MLPSTATTSYPYDVTKTVKVFVSSMYGDHTSASSSVFTSSSMSTTISLLARLDWVSTYKKVMSDVKTYESKLNCLKYGDVAVDIPLYSESLRLKIFQVVMSSSVETRN